MACKHKRQQDETEEASSPNSGKIQKRHQPLTIDTELESYPAKYYLPRRKQIRKDDEWMSPCLVCRVQTAKQSGICKDCIPICSKIMSSAHQSS